jgi:hypothetical protein
MELKASPARIKEKRSFYRKKVALPTVILLQWRQFFEAVIAGNSFNMRCFHGKKEGQQDL